MLTRIWDALSSVLRGGVLLLLVIVAALLLVYVVLPVTEVLKGMVSNSKRIPVMAEERAEEKARRKRQ